MMQKMRKSGLHASTVFQKRIEILNSNKYCHEIWNQCFKPSFFLQFSCFPANIRRALAIHSHWYLIQTGRNDWKTNLVCVCLRVDVETKCIGPFPYKREDFYFYFSFFIDFSQIFYILCLVFVDTNRGF